MFFEWDKAKISELAANRRKSYFQCEKAKNSVTAANKRKKVFGAILLKKG